MYVHVSRGCRCSFQSMFNQSTRKKSGLISKSSTIYLSWAVSKSEQYLISSPILCNKTILFAKYFGRIYLDLSIYTYSLYVTYFDPINTYTMLNPPFPLHYRSHTAILGHFSKFQWNFPKLNNRNSVIDRYT